MCAVNINADCHLLVAVIIIYVGLWRGLCDGQGRFLGNHEAHLRQRGVRVVLGINFEQIIA